MQAKKNASAITRRDFIISDSNGQVRTLDLVMKYMQGFGYKVIPVNPFAVGEKINGEIVVENLEKIYEKLDIVDIFRPSKETP